MNVQEYQRARKAIEGGGSAIVRLEGEKTGRLVTRLSDLPTPAEALDNERDLQAVAEAKYRQIAALEKEIEALEARARQIKTTNATQPEPVEGAADAAKDLADATKPSDNLAALTASI